MDGWMGGLSILQASIDQPLYARHRSIDDVVTALPPLRCCRVHFTLVFGKRESRGPSWARTINLMICSRARLGRTSPTPSIIESPILSNCTLLWAAEPFFFFFGPHLSASSFTNKLSFIHPNTHKTTTSHYAFICNFLLFDLDLINNRLRIPLRQ